VVHGVNGWVSPSARELRRVLLNDTLLGELRQGARQMAHSFQLPYPPTEVALVAQSLLDSSAKIATRLGRSLPSDAALTQVLRKAANGLV
jgi:hypothetical protein